MSGAAGPALVELLPQVLHDSPAAMLLVDLNRGEVTYANRQAVLMAPGLGLPVKISDWSQAPASAHADHHAIVEQPGFNGTTNTKVWRPA